MFSMQECMASGARGVPHDFRRWLQQQVPKKRIDLWGSGGPPTAVESHSARPSAVATLSTPRGLGLVLSLPPGQ